MSIQFVARPAMLINQSLDNTWIVQSDKGPKILYIKGIIPRESQIGVFSVAVTRGGKEKEIHVISINIAIY